MVLYFGVWLLFFGVLFIVPYAMLRLLFCVTFVCLCGDWLIWWFWRFVWVWVFGFGYFDLLAGYFNTLDLGLSLLRLVRIAFRGFSRYANLWVL